MRPRVLVVDDEETIRKLLRGRLEREGHEVTVCSNAAEAEKELRDGREVGVMVTDLKMPGKDGFGLMDAAREENPQLRVVVITGHGEKAAAVQALRKGASDYLEKPFDMEELSHAVRRGLREYQLERENSDLVDRLEARLDRVEGKGESTTWYDSQDPSMAKVTEWLSVLKRESLRSEADEPNVLILGESGTGKEGVAQQVHQGSKRVKGPWVVVNCANFNEQLLESELFGHEKGAFTGANALKRGLFEIAKGGTLFLDEMGEMDIKLQAKLLRVLQEKAFRRVGGTQDLTSDVRVVAATNQNLDQRVKSGEFREDLFHRLSQVVVELPPLRERKSDLVAMAAQFAENSFRMRGKTFGGFTPDAEDAVHAYPWPGNVRELLNVIERTALVWQGTGPVSAKTLSLPQGQGAPAAPGPNGGGHVVGVQTSNLSPEEYGVRGYMELKKKWSHTFEREYLVSSLQRHNGNVSAAAREARIDRSNFLRLLRRHGLRAQEYRKAA